MELEDGIINYFKLNKNEDPTNVNKMNYDKSIYLINYPEDNDVVVSYGQPPNYSESEIIHKCTIKEGSSGSPILLINNQKLIGGHYGYSMKFELNKGTLLIYIISLS